MFLHWKLKSSYESQRGKTQTQHRHKYPYKSKMTAVSVECGVSDAPEKKKEIKT